MSPVLLAAPQPLLAGYLIVFTAAALACLIGAWRARRIESSGVRLGLVALLGTSGLWAGTYVGMLLVSTPFLKTRFYEVGLVVGLATVGAWLWFCSAYSGRQLHRNRTVRRAALLLFGVVSLTKLTNPWHGFYFSAQVLEGPFPHLSVNHHALYWVTAALSYMGASVGFFMLYESLRRVQVWTGRLAVLFGLTILPVAANAVGYVTPHLLDVSHEPVGVAAFAIGVLFVYRDQFEATSQAGRREKPTLILSEEGGVWNYNDRAAALFPALKVERAVGTDLAELLPEVAEALMDEAETCQVGEEGEIRHYRPDESTFGRGSGRRVVLTDVTERALRRRVREQQHRFLTEAVGQAQEAVLVTEAESLDEPGPSIIYANEAFEEMTGYAEEEVLGQTPRLLQGPATDRDVVDSLRAALEAGEEWEGETINYRKDGTPYIVHWNITPVRKEDGHIEHWISVQRDVTEQRRQEKALRRQKNLLEQTQRLAGAWEVDLQAGEMSWSEEVYRIHEVEPETEMGVAESLTFCAPRARPKMWEAFDRCTEEAEPYDLELPIVTAEGNRRWVRTVGGPVETEDGEVTKVAGAFQDITERKEAEDELQRSRERYRSLFEDSNDAILVHDLEGRIQEANPRAGALFGREAGEVEGTTIRDLYAPGEKETAQKKLQALRAGESYQAVSRYKQAGGSPFWGEVSASVTEIEGETVVRTLIRDVTEREESRRQLERYREYTDRLLGAVDDLFFVFDGETRLRRWNGRVPEVTGYSEEELEEMNALDFVSESERERVGTQIANVFMTGHAQMEIPFLREDGTTVPYEIVGNLVEHPEDGLRVVGIGRDISERRRRERTLERQNDLFERAQEIANGGAWQFDVQSGEFTLTDQGYRVHGLAPGGDMTPERSHELIHPEERSKADEAFRRAIEHGEPYDIEARLITEEGEERWIRTRGEPQRENGNPEGEVARVRGTIQDITERKEREQRLAVTSQRLEAILKHTTRPMFVKNRDGEYLLTNRRFRELLGLEEGEALGQTDRDLFPPEMAQAVGENDQAVLRDGTSVEREERIQANGEWRTYLSAKAPLYDVGTEQGSEAPVALFGVATDITERKQRERQLQQAETMFQNAQDALFLIDVEGNQQGEDERAERMFSVRRVNPAYEGTTGLSEEDIRGRSPHEIIGGEAGQHMERRYRECARRREPLEYNEELPLGDRATYWKTRIAPVVVEGQVQQIVGTTRNVTEQRRRKETLERQNDLFERAQEIADVGAWEYDVASGELRWTDHVHRIYGREEACGPAPSVDSAIESYHPDDHSAIRKAFTEAIEEGTPYDIEVRLMTAGGEERWVRTRGEPQRKDGEVVRIRGTIQDITDRRERERALCERQDKVEALYEATNQLLRSGDKEAVGSYLVRLIDETFDFAGVVVRYVEEDLVEGDPVEEGQLVPAKLSDTLQARMPERLPYDLEGDSPVAEAYQSGQAQVYDDLRNVESAVNRGDVRAAAYVPMGTHGTLSVGSLQAGGIKDFDRRLIEVLAGYAALVLDRLEREEALLAAKEEAEKASRMKSSFLANMSHEVRTPLTSIIGFAEALGTEASELDLPEGVALAKYANLIEQGGKRLLETLEGVLNLSKLEAGRMDLGEGPVDLATEVQRTVDELRSKAREKDIGLQVQTERAETGVDKGGVQIVARNLLSNALKYTEREGTVWLRTYRDEGGAVLEVEDTGIGMEPDQVQNLFEPFRQASEGFSREYEGTGVGLAVVKMAIEQMGGTLECQTEKGEGTCFTARLPTGRTEAGSRS